MMRRLTLVLAVLVASALAVPVAQAQGVQTSPFGVPLPPSVTQAAGPGPAASPPSAYQRAWYWLLAEQQRVNRQLVAAVKQMKNGDMLGGTLLLAFLSFMYGILHAAGPGHGKAVISSYVLANEKTVRRGIMLSFLAALFQAFSAIAVVGVLAVVLNATSLEIRATEAWIETVSWAFVAAVGLWLLWGQVKTFWQGRRAKAGETVAADMPTGAMPLEQSAHLHDHGEGCECGHAHAHHDHHHHGAPRVEPFVQKIAPLGAGSIRDGSHPDTHYHADGEVCPSCGHAHMPDPKDLQGDLSWSKALAIAFSIGIRPCTGAILVLIFSLSQGLFLAGVFSTFAMALGTAITVSLLASLALGSRDLAVRLAGAGRGWAGMVASSAAFAGSALVFLMGVSFFIASLNGTGPL